MTDTKFTPGPWEVWADRGEIWMVRQSNGNDIYLGCLNGDSDEADACLIAAAPDLFAACGEALAALDALAEVAFGLDHDPALAATVELAQRAILSARTRARGEA